MGEMNYTKFKCLYNVAKQCGIDTSLPISKSLPMAKEVLGNIDLVFCGVMTTSQAIKGLKRQNIRVIEPAFRMLCLEAEQDYEMYCLEHKLFN